MTAGRKVRDVGGGSMPFLFVVGAVTPLLVATIAGKPLMTLLRIVWLSVTSWFIVRSKGESREKTYDMGLSDGIVPGRPIGHHRTLWCGTLLAACGDARKRRWGVVVVLSCGHT
jgi:hypothetical protein